MAAERYIFQLGSHPKKIQRMFFIQGAKFHALGSIDIEFTNVILIFSKIVILGVGVSLFIYLFSGKSETTLRYTKWYSFDRQLYKEYSDQIWLLYLE